MFGHPFFAKKNFTMSVAQHLPSLPWVVCFLSFFLSGHAHQTIPWVVRFLSFFFTLGTGVLCEEESCNAPPITTGVLRFARTARRRLRTTEIEINRDSESNATPSSNVNSILVLRLAPPPKRTMSVRHSTILSKAEPIKCSGPTCSTPTINCSLLLLLLLSLIQLSGPVAAILSGDSRPQPQSPRTFALSHSLFSQAPYRSTGTSLVSASPF